MESATITIQRDVAFHRGQRRPFRSTYRTVGPDGRVYTNDSLVTLRQLLKRRYPGTAIVESWKA